MKSKIRWYRYLYLGEKAEKKDIWEKLRGNGIHPRLFLLVLPSNPSNVLDILPQPVLFQEHYQKIPLYVVGAAWGKKEAMELAGKIIMETYRTTGTTKAAEYLGDDFLDEPEEAGEELYREWQ